LAPVLDLTRVENEPERRLRALEGDIVPGLLGWQDVGGVNLGWSCGWLSDGDVVGRFNAV
jgi:hypothetical protein